MPNKRVRKQKAVRETLARYDAEAQAHEAPSSWSSARISSKNQITLPAAMLRELGLAPGDELDVLSLGDALYLQKRLTGRAQGKRLMGSLAGTPGWRTKEEIDAWIAESRSE